jgi:hypothetical protein
MERKATPIKDEACPRRFDASWRCAWPAHACPITITIDSAGAAYPEVAKLSRRLAVGYSLYDIHYDDFRWCGYAGANFILTREATVWLQLYISERTKTQKETVGALMKINTWSNTDLTLFFLFQSSWWIRDMRRWNSRVENEIKKTPEPQPSETSMMKLGSSPKDCVEINSASLNLR